MQGARDAHGYRDDACSRTPPGVDRHTMMMLDAPAISRFPVPALADLPDDLRPASPRCRTKPLRPNVFLVLAHRPPSSRVLRLSRRTDAQGGRTAKAEREIIVAETSGANDCLYCVVAAARSLPIPRRTRSSPTRSRSTTKADLTPRRRAMLDFAIKVALHSSQIDQTDTPACASTGSLTDAWDIAAIAAVLCDEQPAGQHDQHAPQRRVLPPSAGCPSADENRAVSRSSRAWSNHQLPTLQGASRTWVCTCGCPRASSGNQSAPARANHQLPAGADARECAS